MGGAIGKRSCGTVSCVVALGIVALLTSPLHAEEAAVPEPFVRLTETPTATLQTAELRLRHASGVTVTLVATIHFAEPSYFVALRRHLTTFDCVIHEGAAARPRTERRIGDANASPSIADLARQGDFLPFGGPVDITADADPATLAALLAAQASPNATAAGTRRSLAAAAMQTQDVPALAAAVERAYAIESRNAIAIETLRHRLARGDRSIALVYGAAHGRDLLARLERLGFAIESRTWHDAFTLGD